MAEKLAEVFEEYDMEVLATRKGRGATILTTEKGLRILEPFRGSVTRLEQEYILKQLLLKEGCDNFDSLILNKDGELLTCDKYRQPYVLKTHYDGTECDMRNVSDVRRAVRALATFHIYGREIARKFYPAWKQYEIEKEEKRYKEIEKALADGEELERVAHLYELSVGALQELLQNAESPKEIDTFFVEDESKEFEVGESVETLFNRHNKQLKKIQKYVLKVKRKNGFEKLFLQVFPEYYQKGLDCIRYVSDVNTLNEEHFGICHGCFNQHNIIMGETSEAIVHFERFSKGNQLNDLYQFARKVMEKNHFNYELLEEIFCTYAEQILLKKEDYKYLLVLFSYPEKFWKISNSYYNTNKAFLSPKFMEKLEAVILQEEEKQQMLMKWNHLLQ